MIRALATAHWTGLECLAGLPGRRPACRPACLLPCLLRRVKTATGSLANAVAASTPTASRTSSSHRGMLPPVFPAGAAVLSADALALAAGVAGCADGVLAGTGDGA